MKKPARTRDGSEVGVNRTRLGDYRMCCLYHFQPCKATFFRYCWIVC
jgi:hypothetical protein